MKHLLIRLVFAFISLCLLAHTKAMAIEEPKFTVLLKEEPFEVRAYEKRLSAVTITSGDMDRAGNQGFRRIADFIFGNNQAQSGESAVSEKIAMTAPVVMMPIKADSDSTSKLKVKDSNTWQVEFTMPSAYELTTLPKPNNPEVQITALPNKTYAVLTYSGLNTENRVQEKIDLLKAWLQQKGYPEKSQAILARYNPPWTLPPWRRNEIWIEIAWTP
jgi:hypothetical protein